MAISVGSVEIDVVPNTRGIYQQLRSALVPPASRVGDEVGRVIGQRVSTHIAPAVRDGINSGARAARPAATRQGNETGGAFARSMRARLEAAFRSMPRLDVRLSDTGVDADLARLRARLEALSGRTIGIDIDAAAARAQAADIEERLRRIGAAHPNVAVRADTAAAIAQLAALREEIDRVSADPARVRVETDGSFGQRLRAAVQQAQASLPEVNITADTTPAQIEVMRLRAQLGQLADQRVGIDIDAAAAMARVEAIQARLQVLAASDADVAVRVDAGAAMTQLAAVQAMVNRLDGQTARVNVNTRGAMRALLQLSVAVAGVAAIPAVPVLAAGIGAVAAAATAAAAGVGALGAAAVPAILDIKNALEAQKQAQDAAATAAAKGGQAAAQAAQRALQLEGAQQALASAHRNAARQIAQAEQGVQDAVRQAADANRRAAQQVVDARQRLADAVQQAADRQRSAAEQVRQAEESLADSQRAAQRAQQDLTQARRDAAAELEELSSRLANAQLSERDAALSVQEARQRLAATQAAGSRATALEQQRAQLAYDQALQRLRDQQTETRRLTEEKQAADTAGVEGSETVQRAQERLAAANEAVRDQTSALARAQQDAARQQVQSQQDIARAQQQVAEAQRSVSQTQEEGARSVARAQQQLVVAQESAAESIAAAQRQIRSAQLSAAGAADQAAVAQAKYQQQLAEMTPATRGTFNAFLALREAFQGWSRELQPEIMPIFTRAIDGLRRALPGLTPFVREAAAAIGELQDRASRAFRSEGWAEFKKDLQGSVRPAIVGLGVSVANIGRGVGGILQAFMPHMDSISGRMQDITGRFADWGTSLKGSPGFERFLAYASTMGPRIAETLGAIGSAFLEIGRALSPLSGPVLEVLGAMASGIASIATDLPWLVQGIWLAIVATRMWTLGMILFNTVANANPIGLVVLAITALVAAVIYAWKNFGWFRTAVIATWEGIKTAALWVWNNALKPTFDALGRVVTWLWNTIIKPYFNFIVGYWRMVGRVAMWLWTNAIKPAFNFIAGIIRWWWDNIVKRYFQLVRGAFRGLAWVANWLWTNAIKPTFNFIAGIITWWWNNIVKRYFGYVRTAISATGSAFKWLYDKAVRPVMGWIGARIDWVWKNVIKPSFDALKRAVRAVRDSFEVAKDGIGKAWKQLEDLTKKPVKFVVNTVYNDGIRKVFNVVADFVGMDKLGAVRLPKGFATGGAVFGPGTATSDSIPAMLSRGEHVWTAREVQQAGGHGTVMALRQMAKAGALPRFAEGGIVDWISDKASRVGSAVMSGVDFLANPGKLWDRAVSAVKDRIGEIGSSKWAKLLARLPQRMLSALKDRVLGAAQAATGGAQWVKPVSAGFGTRFGVAGARWASGRHTGLDFPAAIGTAVRAVADGRVSRARNAGPYGMHVVIDHGGGLQSLYAHLSKILTKVGARVTAGQRIGSVGSTGNSTGPHLHLEARRNGRAIDPMPLLTGDGGPSGGRGVERWRGVVQRALGLVGQPRSLANTTLRRMNQESGGDPRAVNRWDVNWQRGHPSVGLMQVIRPTFERYAGQFRGKGPKLYGVSVDPLANIFSSMRYALARYGGLARAYDRPGGYDSGGYLMPGQLGYNGLSQPEAVLTPRQWNAVSTLAARGAGGDGPAVFEGRLYLDSGEFLGTVRGEMDRRDQQLVSVLRAGRR